ncbi:hypothetical protein J2755_000582 [Methanohalophilus levihalophilus]|uniref:hypothetical protein n=1 Tax=Methanohalophilus levihalophilus TaxID=1431282 RepID=UPI001AE73862|nr:hypothetical protein [Methanohalophilus levihalophilus]MBP2029662.1 hypothetical protein [Methanohalophilus levihalophilus]
MDDKNKFNFSGKTNWLFPLLILFLVTAMVMVSGCQEDEPGLDSNEGDTGEQITVSEGLQINEWKIIVDKVQINLENTGESEILVNKIAVEIYVDDNLSVSKPFEVDVNTELAPGEVRLFTIGVQAVRDLDQSRVKSIEIT